MINLSKSVRGKVAHANGKIDLNQFDKIVIFTGAGMSAESGIPTYRGEGGVWKDYYWRDYACQRAFETDFEKVIKFHELRRKSIIECEPHAGHIFVTTLQKSQKSVCVITQNIDGMHQKAGTKQVVELHGSLWRLRCENCGKVYEDYETEYTTLRCKCEKYLRPDIVWFGDVLNSDIVNQAIEIIRSSDLFISVGTSGIVWPAAGIQKEAKSNGAYCIELNTELTELSDIYDKVINCNASEIGSYFLI